MSLKADKEDLEKRLSDKGAGGEMMVCGGSAVPLVSLPQEPTPASLTHSFLCQTLIILKYVASIFSPITFYFYYNFFSSLISFLCWFQRLNQTTACTKPHLSTSAIPTTEKWHLPSTLSQRWWGPQQAGWNPPMN